MEEIKAKQVGKNVIVIIDNQKFTKVCTAEEATTLKNKILLFNKKNSKSLKEQILKLVDKSIKVKEEKEAKTKGIKKALKKVTKSVKSKFKKVESKSLVEQVETEFKEGNFSEEEIKRLEDLLKKKKEALISEPKAEVKAQDSTSDNGSRERYR